MIATHPDNRRRGYAKALIKPWLKPPLPGAEIYPISIILAANDDLGYHFFKKLCFGNLDETQELSPNTVIKIPRMVFGAMVYRPMRRRTKVKKCFKNMGEKTARVALKLGDKVVEVFKKEDITSSGGAPSPAK